MQADDIFCCLGTTMKKAGSKDEFYKVDFTYIVNSAKIAALNNAKQFILVSSLGADNGSPFYYSRVKGQTERAVKKLPFWAIHILRPSVLAGERDEIRTGERLATRVGSFLHSVVGSFLDKYAPIAAERVAKFMVSKAQGTKGGVFIYESDEIQRAKF
jgi:Predicted nucleoside-diphosphate-sugar epimerases